MSRPRVHVHEDLSYSQWHRDYLPHLYVRRGHRFDVVDRDWSEFCHYCREPLALIETLRDVGQDITDKNTRQTVRWAEMAGKDAFIAAFQVPRPSEVQARIDALEREVRELENAYPITGFRTRQLYPRPASDVRQMTPVGWAKAIHDLHLRHYVVCPRRPALSLEEVARVDGDHAGRMRLL